MSAPTSWDCRGHPSVCCMYPFLKTSGGTSHTSFTPRAVRRVERDRQTAIASVEAVECDQRAYASFAYRARIVHGRLGTIDSSC